MRDRVAARLARSLAVATMLIVGVFPSTARAQEIDCDSESEREVRAVRFEGNETLSEDELSARELTTPSTFTHRYFGWLLNAGVKRSVPDVGLRRDVLALQEYYKGNGFYRARVDNVVAPAGDNRVNVTFRIDEGRPSIIDTLTIIALDSIEDSDDVVRDLQLQIGGRFGRIRLAADIDTITSR